MESGGVGMGLPGTRTCAWIVRKLDSRRGSLRGFRRLGLYAGAGARNRAAGGLCYFTRPLNEPGRLLARRNEELETTPPQCEWMHSNARVVEGAAQRG